jgi:pimeloyl-ACP methyl ester carboxylesterase
MAVTTRARGEHDVTVKAGAAALPGDLCVPEGARGLVLFAHGSGSSRRSPRNRFVADQLRDAGLGTLLFDLLLAEEESAADLRFDIDLLAERLGGAIRWAAQDEETRGLRLGAFGASTGAAAALVAAARNPDAVHAVVSRGGRPDLAGGYLPLVKAPTLLIVGGDDAAVIGLNRQAATKLRSPSEMAIVPGATHLFEEPGKLEEVARLAADWFTRHL